jgi:hypothetical protein
LPYKRKTRRTRQTMFAASSLYLATAYSGILSAET